MPQHIAQNPFVIHPPQDLTILKRQSDALSRKYVDGERPVTEQDLQAMGRALWNALDIQTEFDAAREAAGAAILPVVIESDRADAQGLPWEMLYHPVHGFIGRHSGFTLTRRIKTAPPSAPPLDKGPLRVLLFTSLPSDVNAERGRLDIEEEQAQVQEALLPWIGKGLVKLDMPNDGRFSTFAEMVKKFAPHVLFLSGHGRFYHQPHMGEPPHGEFQFEGEVDGSNLVKEDKIAEALVGTGAQLVILSACESGKAASDALNNGLMRRISAQGIPHVIGMRESVLDVAGTFFVRALCDALGGRERVDAAAQAARAAIFNLFDEASEAAKLLSSAQWPLPILISSAPHSPLIDWEFAPQAVEPRVFNRALSTVSLPPRFVGRRAELRRWQNDVLSGKTRALLITGPGGQGKTALAGELALSLQKRGWRVFAWRAQLGSAWRSFEFEMEMALEKAHAERYDRAKGGLNSDGERARWLFGLLAEQFNGQVALFLDNLETLQDPSTLHLRDPQVKAWMEAAQVAPELTLLVTSRWKIPNWNGEHLPLDHASYGDFLQMARLLAQNGQMPASLLQDRDKMHRVYDALGGNSRGLGFFAAAAQGMMTAADEEEFMQAVAKAQEDEKADMAIEVIYKHLPAYAQTLLHRLPAFAEPVPVEGLIKLGLDLPNPQELVSRLLDVSLLGAQEEPSWDAVQYACAALVRDWLSQNKLVDENPAWLNSVAEYHVYLLSNERPTVGQAMTAIQALRRAGRTAQADRLTLDVIIGPLTNAGLYRTLLGEWLPPILNSPDKQTRGQALGQGGKLLLHLGDFKQALPVLQESLAIQQEIGDKAGEGATLNNISTLYHAQGEYATALEYLKKSLTIQQEIGDKAGEGTTLNNISQIYDAQGEYATALEYMKKSLAIMQEIGDKKGEGTTLNNISQIYAAQGEYATALEYLKKSLAIRQEIGDKKGEGATLNNISTLYHAQGEYATALEYLKKSLAIMQEIGDKKGEGTTLNNISQIYDAQGDYATALEYMKKSLAIQHEIGDKAGEGTTLNNISQIYHAQGEYATALEYLKKSLAIMQEIGDKNGEGMTLNNTSALYYARGDYATALEYLKKSLAIMQEIGDKKGEGATLNNISQIYDARGDYATALEYLKKSLAIQQEIGDKAGKGTTLNNISQIYAAQGEYATALEYLKKSLAIRQEIGDKAGLCATLFNMGHIYAQNNEMQEATGTWVITYLIAKQINSAQALQALANLAPQLGLPAGLGGWEQLAEQMQAQGGRQV